MTLGNWFRLGNRRSDDPAMLREFLRRQGAFVAQKTVLDYCRVKAGRDESRLFGDPDFQAALTHCRWQTFIGALADVTALAEAWLRPHAPEDRIGRLAEGLLALHAAALAEEPPPEAERAAVSEAGALLVAHLAVLQAAPPLPAHRLPMLADAPLFATLPIAAEQRAGETPAIRGALRFHLVTTQQEMERRFAPGPLTTRLLNETPSSGSSDEAHLKY